MEQMVLKEVCDLKKRKEKEGEQLLCTLVGKCYGILGKGSNQEETFPSAVYSGLLALLPSTFLNERGQLASTCAAYTRFGRQQAVVRGSKGGGQWSVPSYCANLGMGSDFAQRLALSMSASLLFKTTVTGPLNPWSRCIFESRVPRNLHK